MVAPIQLPKQTFKTYKEKVLYILQTLNEQLLSPSELTWCLHVIKNDFLQISNSILANPTGARRFSKT